MRSFLPRASHKTSPQRRSQGVQPILKRSGLKILVAGVDKDARAAVEVYVRQALSGRDPAEPWSVGLVRVGASWSVSLKGPGERPRSVSFSAEPHRLAEAIREEISRYVGEPVAPLDPTDTATIPYAARDDRGPAAAAGTIGSMAARSRVQDRHVCKKCQQTILVSYEGEPGEPKERAPVACPHCWAVSQVEIGGWAAAGGDYVAEKA